MESAVISPVDADSVQRILDQGWLYRGTSDKHFQIRKEYYPFYFSRKPHSEQPITYTSIRVGFAMSAAENRTEEHNRNGGVLAGSRPLLLAINPKNYMERMRHGLEGREIEIIGGIDFKDILIIDSVETFLKVCGRHLQLEKEDCLRRGNFDYKEINTVDTFRRLLLWQNTKNEQQ